MTETAAIILAAGQGKRLRSATSKLLHMLAGKRVIDYTIALVRGLNCSKIIVVVPPGETNPVTAYLRAAHPDILLAVQAEPKGTGDAVAATRKLLKSFTGDSLILCGDAPLLTPDSLKRFYKSHLKSDADFSLLTCIPDDPTGYGRIIRDADGAFADIIEEKDATARERTLREVNGGIYWTKTAPLFKALGKVTPRNRQGEYYLTDVPKIFKKNRPIHTWCIADAGDLQGINTRQDLAQAHRILYNRIRSHWMDRGVTLVDPATIYIEPDVTLSADCIIEPQCHLRGTTSIGAATHVSTGAVIENATIGATVSILPYCVIRDSKLDDNTQVGPFAHLRPQTHLKKGAKVGNFVEIKKTTLNEGAKASHLTYLGDATIGKNANIGAGTITCNYDGVNKWTTEIGDGAFIGSNTALVAPIVIGSHAVVGAGSTLTKPVPDGALGVSRAPQTIVNNWTLNKREKR